MRVYHHYKLIHPRWLLMPTVAGDKKMSGRVGGRRLWREKEQQAHKQCDQMFQMFQMFQK
jgi:hypothetical protein